MTHSSKDAADVWATYQRGQFLQHVRQMLSVKTVSESKNKSRKRPCCVIDDVINDVISMTSSQPRASATTQPHDSDSEKYSLATSRSATTDCSPAIVVEASSECARTAYVMYAACRSAAAAATGCRQLLLPVASLTAVQLQYTVHGKTTICLPTDSAAMFCWSLLAPSQPAR